MINELVLKQQDAGWRWFILLYFTSHPPLHILILTHRALLRLHVSVCRGFPRADLHLGSSCENLTGSHLPTGDGGGRFLFNKTPLCPDALLQVRAERVMQNQGGLHRTAKLQIKVEAERVTHKRTHVSSERFAVKCHSAT